MIRTVNGIVLLILHLTVCILIWAGIRSGMLKVKKYLIIPVIFVPVWGALSMLILHLQVFSKAENSRQIGVEKLQVNEEIYKNNFRSVEENDHDIVPLEEALLINKQKCFLQRNNLLIHIRSCLKNIFINFFIHTKLFHSRLYSIVSFRQPLQMQKQHTYRPPERNKNYKSDQIFFHFQKMCLYSHPDQYTTNNM